MAQAAMKSEAFGVYGTIHRKPRQKKGKAT